MTHGNPGTLPAAAGRVVPDMPALTALRAVAALLVFLFHFPPYGYGRIADIVVSQGHVGVTVFFVLSGFLITLRYYRPFERGERGLGDYFVRRAARILPLYYVVLILTHVFSTGSVPLDREHLPEWTLTQALFDAGPEAITVPTSWSLTVEECFYALAPLLFVSLALVRRRLGAMAGSIATLVAGVALFLLAGGAIVQLATPRRVGDLHFLTNPELFWSYTIFGRFPEFALGAAAGLLFLSGRIEALWRRRGGALASTVLAVLGAALLVAGQAGMVRDASAWWECNLVVALASALIVVALTCGNAPLSRLLAVRPAVYLGRTSYALYLIQLTPLGKGLLFAVLPGADGLSLIALYAGMCLVSALLFELVEEPARDTILALWRRRTLRLPGATALRQRAAALAILLGALLVQHGFWAVRSLGPVDEARVLHVLGDDSKHVLRTSVAATADGRHPRVALPEGWLVGPAADRRPPAALLVFADGAAVPFGGLERPADVEPLAYYRVPRSRNLSLQVDEAASLTLVHHTPLVATALAGSLALEQPGLAILPLIVLGAGALLWSRRWLAVPTPRTSVAVAVGLVAVWLLAGLADSPAAPAVIGLELLLIAHLARGARRTATQGDALGASAA